MDTRIKYWDNKASVLLCQQVYDKEAILAAAYLLTGQYCIEFNDCVPDYQIVISCKDGKSLESSIVESFVNNCLDEQLRITLDNRTGKIRELIVKHAFKPLDLQKELGSANG